MAATAARHVNNSVVHDEKMSVNNHNFSKEDDYCEEMSVDLPSEDNKLVFSHLLVFIYLT